VTAPETERVVDIEAILAAVTDRTRLIFIANPANPTGTMLPLSAFEVLAARLPDQCLLVMDGAYVEYAEGYDGGARLVEARDNVVMTRTFSKVYGLGGVRVGYGYAPRDVIEVLTRIRGPFNLSTMALGGRGGGAARHRMGGEALRVNADERARLTGVCASLASAATTARRISCLPVSPTRRGRRSGRASEGARDHRARAQELRLAPLSAHYGRTAAGQ
jgi:histidinol-phosphate aminotransferase